MKTMRWWVVAAALMAGGAQAQMVEINWDASGGFAHEDELQPGKFIELCEKLAPGRNVGWRYDALGPLDFNVHYHVGKKVHYPVQRKASQQGDGVLKPAGAQEYCWMWTNKTDGPVSLKLSLQRR